MANVGLLENAVFSSSDFCLVEFCFQGTLQKWFHFCLNKYQPCCGNWCKSFEHRHVAGAIVGKSSDWSHPGGGAEVGPFLRGQDLILDVGAGAVSHLNFFTTAGKCPSQG